MIYWSGYIFEDNGQLAFGWSLDNSLSSCYFEYILIPLEFICPQITLLKRYYNLLLLK